MRITKNIFLLLSALFFLGACQKDIDYFLPDPGQGNGPDTTWHTTVTTSMPVMQLKHSLLLAKHRDSFELTNTAAINTHSGLQLSFPLHSLVTLQGLAVSGRITAETILLKKKGDMLRMGIPTVSNDRLLLSGGAFFISLKKDSIPLQIAPQAGIQVKFNTANPSGNMMVFNGQDNLPTAFNWLPNYDTSRNRVLAGLDFYQVYSNQLNWINCDYFYDSAGTTLTSMAVKLPSNYTNANTMVWIAFNDMFSVTSLQADVPNRRFVSGRIPSNKSVTIIVLSQQGPDFYLAHQQVVTVAASAGSPTLVQLAPVITSLDNIRNYLNSL